MPCRRPQRQGVQGDGHCPERPPRPQVPSLGQLYSFLTADGNLSRAPQSLLPGGRRPPLTSHLWVTEVNLSTQLLILYPFHESGPETGFSASNRGCQ